jgi:hypothetical protein
LISPIPNPLHLREQTSSSQINPQLLDSNNNNFTFQTKQDRKQTNEISKTSKKKKGAKKKPEDSTFKGSFQNSKFNQRPKDKQDHAPDINDDINADIRPTRFDMLNRNNRT